MKQTNIQGTGNEFGKRSPLQSSALKSVLQITKIHNPLPENKFSLYWQGLGRLKSCHDDKNRDTITS
jgi:hypothetical protein